MRSMPRRLLLVLLALVVPGLAAAQGLGDVAARERQKRAAAGPRAKPRVLSNDDLRKDEAGKAASQATAPSPESSSDSPSAPGSERAPENEEAAAQRGRLEQAQAEVDSARAAVVAAEARIKDLGDKLNPMSPSFIYGAGQTGDAAGEEIRTRQALQQAEGELGQARDALVRANRSYEDVRQGRPAGSSEPR